MRETDGPRVDGTHASERWWTHRYAALPSSSSLLLPLVEVFLLQSLRVMHMSRPHWRRKKQLMSTSTSSRRRAATPSPTTAPRPRPLNRESAETESKHTLNKRSDPSARLNTHRRRWREQLGESDASSWSRSETTRLLSSLLFSVTYKSFHGNMR